VVLVDRTGGVVAGSAAITNRPVPWPLGASQRPAGFGGSNQHWLTGSAPIGGMADRRTPFAERSVLDCPTCTPATAVATPCPCGRPQSPPERPATNRRCASPPPPLTFRGIWDRTKKRNQRRQEE